MYARAEARDHNRRPQVLGVTGEFLPGLSQNTPGEPRGYRRANEFQHVLQCRESAYCVPVGIPTVALPAHEVPNGRPKKNDGVGE